ncbi:flagellar basal body P-ring protein FlgI [Amnimonas aquatica]|uniref:Flagellar P-ring protein n=1 Tax=Amnimonas aquatica TaxID=2094561 RepID=A0A2P6ATZ8_9GAMM|nr:flagellar basal body P-ring protein FlgI [Amnimonas aquatica]PQA48902.1 flagellar biosynthesis protein FlgI [Amnimonas aquatica]
MNSRFPSSLKALALIAAVVLPMLPALAQAERVKDLVSISGVRGNQLVGYGLVVGLAGTGDQTSQAQFTIQSIRNMLSRFGVKVPDNINPQLKNVAAVMVHATLPPFAKPGQNIDVTVSSIGNAGSLRGGSLLMTPLTGADGQIYAMAQGSLLVGGMGASGQDGSRITVNVPSAGRIPGGASVERQAPGQVAVNGQIQLNLNSPDFTTANRLVEEINRNLGEGVARAMDATTVAVQGPADPDRQISFISILENMEIKPAEAPARVVVNSRTGTIVIGGTVRTLPAAVTHGSLTVTIKENPRVSQPAPFSQGQTAIVPDSTIAVEQATPRMFKLDTGNTLDDVVRAINAVGAAPSDLVAILEALSQAGALRAELIVI